MSNTSYDNPVNRPMDWTVVLKSSDVSPRIQAHLVKVYRTLAATLLATCLGVIVDLSVSMGGLLTSLAGIFLLYLLYNNPNTPMRTRTLYLLGFGFFQGCSIAPLIQYAAISIDPSIVLLALGGVTAIFVCFSLSAIHSQRRSFLFLGGMLSSAVSFMALLSLMSIFWRPMWVHSTQLYFGLAVFSAYILYDTQLIIEKADKGSTDYVLHALELFIDFIQVFVRILIILIKNAQEKESKKKSRQ